MRRYTELPTSQLPLKMRMSLSIPQPALLRLRLFGVGSINIGDWCPGFLEAGAPLVLVTAFKLLDMILEWVLDQNGYQSTFRFAQKLKALRGSVQFPPLIGSRPWLQTRIVSLYASPYTASWDDYSRSPFSSDVRQSPNRNVESRLSTASSANQRNGLANSRGDCSFAGALFRRYLDPRSIR